jgi:hypothetical protein
VVSAYFVTVGLGDVGSVNGLAEAEAGFYSVSIKLMKRGATLVGGRQANESPRHNGSRCRVSEGLEGA